MIRLKKLENILLKIMSNMAFLMVVTSLCVCSGMRIYQPTISDSMKNKVGSIMENKLIDRRI